MDEREIHESSPDKSMTDKKYSAKKETYIQEERLPSIAESDNNIGGNYENQNMDSDDGGGFHQNLLQQKGEFSTQNQEIEIDQSE